METKINPENAVRRGPRILRRLLLGLAWLITLVVLIYGEENWRGGRAWEKYRSAHEALGQQLDLARFVPKSVPDEQNFGAATAKYFFSTNGGMWNADNYTLADTKVTSSGNSRLFIDLPAWASAFDAVAAGTIKTQVHFKSATLDAASRAAAAPAVLRGLQTNEAVLAELKVASRLPLSVYPVKFQLENPWGILLPHLSAIKGAALRWQLRACAELALGQSDAALEDIELILRLSESLKGESFIISYLVRAACVQLAVQPIWEGLSEHRWTEAQLARLQARLEGYSFLEDLQAPLATERAAGVATGDLLHRNKYRMTDLFDAGNMGSGGEFLNLVARAMPGGWYHLEQLNYCRLFEGQLQDTYDPLQKRVWPGRVDRNAHELEREISGSAGSNHRVAAIVLHHRLLSSMLLPALGNLTRKAAAVQTATDQAALACALERVRLATGKLPAGLEEAASRFKGPVPHDIITGEPFRYRRLSDEQFVLYSVGWNEKDDGGVAGKKPFDEKEGDWVWENVAEKR